MLRLSLGGSVSVDSKCVNVGFKQVAEGIINHTMSLHAVHAGECLGHHCNVKVTLSVPGALMSNVQLTLIPDH